jgi:recombination protein RecT
VQSLTEKLGDEKRKRFILALEERLNANPDLKNADPLKVIATALQAEAYNLSHLANSGHYYIIPYKKKDGVEPNFQLGYLGMLELARRAGRFKVDPFTIEVKQGEVVKIDYYTNTYEFETVEDLDSREDLPTVGFLAKYVDIDDCEKVVYMTKKQVLKHAEKYTPGFTIQAFEALERGDIPKDQRWKYSGSWYTEFSKMAQKTVLRQLLKYAPMSAEYRGAIEHDEITDSIVEQEVYVEATATVEPPKNIQSFEILEAEDENEEFF